MPEDTFSTNKGEANADQQGDNQGNSFSSEVSQDPTKKATDESSVLSKEAIDAIVKRDTHAQDHIKKLEEEAANLREALLTQKTELEQAATYKEVLDGIATNQQQSEGATNLSSEELVKLTSKQVREELDATKATEVQDANWNAVTKALTSKYGDKTDEHVKARCSELGITWEAAVDMAKKSPKLFESSFNVAREVKVNTGAEGSLSTAQFQGKPPAERKKFSELRSTKERADAYLELLNETVKSMSN